MAISLTISTKELARQAGLVFEGKTYKVFLAQNSGSLTAESTTSAWEAVELSGNGYTAVTGTISTGSYNTNQARYVLPTITAAFTAGTGGFTYDTVCLKIGTATYLHSIAVESPAISLASGQTRTYILQLSQDD